MMEMVRAREVRMLAELAQKRKVISDELVVHADRLEQRLQDLKADSAAAAVMMGNEQRQMEQELVAGVPELLRVGMMASMTLDALSASISRWGRLSDSGEPPKSVRLDGLGAVALTRRLFPGRCADERADEPPSEPYVGTGAGGACSLAGGLL